MRRITGLLLPLFAIAFGIVQARTTPSTTPSTRSVELEQLSKQWMNAMLGHNKAKLEELMAPNYVLYTPNPQHPETPRAEWLDNLYNHLKIDRWEQTDISAHVYGDIGVVTSAYNWSGTFREKAFDSNGHCTDVWRNHNRHWRVVSRTCMAAPGSLTLGGVAK